MQVARTTARRERGAALLPHQRSDYIYRQYRAGVAREKSLFFLRGVALCPAGVNFDGHCNLYLSVYFPRQDGLSLLCVCERVCMGVCVSAGCAHRNPSSTMGGGLWSCGV
eukprot:scaffold32040_cov69-Phaeocystis_antarctica.AAC.1